tara:strand:- start:203 stop:346 length:144 start_codon:yes stop_codon:yes gene_type:complete
MNLRITKLSNEYNAKKIFALVYENENGKIYSLKLPLRYSLVITLKKY